MMWAAQPACKKIPIWHILHCEWLPIVMQYKLGSQPVEIILLLR